MHGIIFAVKVDQRGDSSSLNFAQENQEENAGDRPELYEKLEGKLEEMNKLRGSSTRFRSPRLGALTSSLPSEVIWLS